MTSTNTRSIPFEFRDVRDDEDPTSAVLRVPACIQSKKDLLAALAAAGRFPAYFGSNWDGLLDCLRDFHWLEEQRIVLAHADLPLKANPQECRIYLEVLRDAVVDWSRGPDSHAPSRAAAMPPHHVLCVTFPASQRATIAELLASDPGT